VIGTRRGRALKALSTIAFAMLAATHAAWAAADVSGRSNIDCIGREGVMFSDHNAQPSCIADRAAFIAGQYPISSGLTRVGTPGGKLGLQAASPTLAGPHSCGPRTQRNTGAHGPVRGSDRGGRRD